MRRKPLVGIVMGSDSDLPVMQEATKALETFAIPYEVRICSAHRSPDLLLRYAREAVARGLRVLIAGAGGAASLAGILAANTSLPVIGVPIESTPLQGMDALLSTAQMPGGVPVATMAIGRPGAKNAGIFAALILGLSDVAIRRRLAEYRTTLAAEVAEKDRRIRAEARRPHPPR